HSDDVNQAAWSYDDTRLASASDDGTARIWDAETGDEMLVLTGNLGSIYTIAWSPYDRLATGSANGTTDGTVSIWNSQTGERL
ncbi:MAG TPA: hypothetical protein PLZ51_07925, partial [Aggregatilineales bacterium]|nr:hypothetical protein [Aggregatilineales bacterium]